MNGGQVQLDRSSKAQLRAEVVAKGSGARWSEKEKLGADRLKVPAGPGWDDQKRAKCIADGLTKIKAKLRKEAEGSGMTALRRRQLKCQTGAIPREAYFAASCRQRSTGE